MSMWIYMLCMLFQSALPRGERLFWEECCVAIHRFQSALPRGERRSLCYPHHMFRLFQSALPRGERLSTYSLSTRYSNFNPRSREGSDVVAAVGPLAIGFDFNPRSREGSDNNFHQKVLFSLSKNCLIHLFFITNFLN